MIKIGDKVMCIKNLNKSYISFKKGEIYEICDIIQNVGDKYIFVYSSDKNELISFRKRPSFYTYFVEKIEN